MDYTNEELHF